MERMRLWRICSVALALVFAFAVPQAVNAVVTVRTVPLDPKNPTTPHVTYPLDTTNEVTIVLGATVDLGGSTDSFTYSWNFGDGSAATTPVAVTQPFDISAQHQYPFGAAGGTTWTAVVTVKDTTTNATYTGNYYVIQEANNLVSRVDVAIDSGLWYLHQSQWRCNNGKLNNVANPFCGVGGVNGTNGKFGGWDAGILSNLASINWQGINATNVQAFEVNGHFDSGPASDPYTDDVDNGLARIFMLLTNSPVASKTYNYVLPSCPSPPCTFTFDGNLNGQAIYASVGNMPMYQMGMIIDAIVASQTPAAVTHTGVAASGPLPGINGISYKDVVQDMVDAYNYCQNTNADPQGGVGGAWGYNCLDQNYNDGSVSQWGAIGEIGASRGFGISIPPIITDANKVWLTADQCTLGAFAGVFGYNTFNWGACVPPWGPFAITPSGLVQLVMDGIGRGDARWNAAETYYHDNFCNPPANGAAAAPRGYTYGLFSATKAMLLHDPGGVLTPIKFMMDEPAGTNGIDWYNAVGPESGGSDACDGVAQTLVKRQGNASGDGGSVGSPNPNNPQGGYWFGHYFNGNQSFFETGWSIIMLRKTVFVSCPQDLNGRGTPSGLAPARIDLTWTGIQAAASYNVLRGTVSGGPYTLAGNTTLPGFSDRTGLVNGGTYYYILQPLNNAGQAVGCESNEAKITIPNKKVY